MVSFCFSLSVANRNRWDGIADLVDPKNILYICPSFSDVPNLLRLSIFFVKCAPNSQLIALGKYSQHLPGCFFVRPPQNILTKSHKKVPQILDLPPPTLIHCKMGMNRSAAVWMAVVAALSSWAYAERIIEMIGRAPDFEEAYEMYCHIAK